VTFLCRM